MKTVRFLLPVPEERAFEADEWIDYPGHEQGYYRNLTVGEDGSMQTFAPGTRAWTPLYPLSDADAAVALEMAAGVLAGTHYESAGFIRPKRSTVGGAL